MFLSFLKHRPDTPCPPLVTSSQMFQVPLTHAPALNDLIASVASVQL